MRFVIHLKPVQPKNIVHGLVEHLKIVKFLRQKKLLTELLPHKRMITFQSDNPGIITHVKKQFGDQIECILSDKHGAGQYRRPTSHVTALKNLKPSAQPLTPLQVANAYNFPKPGTTLNTKVVAIIELGGGFNPTNIINYCKAMGVLSPRLYWHSVSGGTNTPDGPDGDDGEVSLDIDIVAAVAPGVKILVVMAPNTTNGFIDAIAGMSTYFLKPDAVSVSWGSPEFDWDDGARQAMDNAIQACMNQGINVFVAAGDDGSTDGTDANTVDYPSSSPYSIACGGTKLILNADGTRHSEVVWNELKSGEGATGGGVSDAYKGRSVPDIAGNADPNSGYIVDIDGTQMSIGGTSAVAPLMAGLNVLLASNLTKPIGNLLTVVVQNPTICFDVVSGNNGGFKASVGRDSCTGLGVPDGTKLLSVLQKNEPSVLHKIGKILKVSVADVLRNIKLK